MISKLPWKINEENPSQIHDADNNLIADNYTFLHVDDFEAICKLMSLQSEYIKCLNKLISLTINRNSIEKIITFPHT